MPGDQSAARRAMLRQWMRDQDRGPTWVARRVGYTREYLSNVLGGRFPFTDALVRACQQRLGIDFGYVGLEEAEDEEDEPEPASMALGGT